MLNELFQGALALGVTVGRQGHTVGHPLPGTAQGEQCYPSNASWLLLLPLSSISAPWALAILLFSFQKSI